MEAKMIFVLGINRYDFKDEQTGRQIAGAKLHYIDFTSKNDNENVSGNIPSTENLPYSMFNEIDGSGFYSVSLGFDLSGRKPKVVFEKLMLVERMSFADYASQYITKSA